MGCFNRTGFYSHLPIHYGDEIVMFVCADTSKMTKRDQCPISVIGTSLIPIALPFFGKYDDYGSIEDVVDDANHRLFTKKIGMTLSEFAEIMHDLSGLTISDLERGVEDYENGKNKTKYHYKAKEDFQRLLSIYNVLFPEPKYDERTLALIRIAEKTDDEEVKERVKSSVSIVDTINSHNNNTRLNTSVILIIEHKAIFDKMVEIGKETYNDDSFEDEEVTPEETFKNECVLIELMKKYPSEFSKRTFNPLTYGITEYGNDYLFLDIEDEEDKKKLDSCIKKRFGLRYSIGLDCCLSSTVYSGYCDYALYNDFVENLEEFEKNIVEYAYFLSAFKRTNTTFEVSPYHSQTTCYDVIIPLYEKMLEIVKKKAEE